MAGGLVHTLTTSWTRPWPSNRAGRLTSCLAERRMSNSQRDFPYQNTEGDPIAARINHAKKYVASTTLHTLDWSNSTLLQGDVVQEITKLKQQDGPELRVNGSAIFLQTLLK